MQIDTTNFNITMSILALFSVALIWWDIKHSFKEDQQRQKREKEEKEALGDVSEITLTRVKFQRYLIKVLDQVASEKITKVILIDEKEVKQGVLLSYAEYTVNFTPMFPVISLLCFHLFHKHVSTYFTQRFHLETGR
jgi:hypothetical protein